MRLTYVALPVGFFFSVLFVHFLMIMFVVCAFLAVRRPRSHLFCSVRQRVSFRNNLAVTNERVFTECSLL